MAGVAPLLAVERLHSQPAADGPTAYSPAVIIVLHGVTGSSGQVAPFAQELADRAAAASGRPVEALLINQRGHGGSRDLCLPPPDTVAASVGDVLAVLRQELGPEAAPAAIMGHSLGGKVALGVAAKLAQAGDPLPKQVWLIDAVAGPTDPATFAMLRGTLASLAGLDQPMESLEAVKQAVADVGMPEPLQQYMASRCEPDPSVPERYRTAFVPAAAVALLDSYCLTDFGSMLDSPPPGLQLHFIRGSESTIYGSCPKEKARFDSGLAAKTAGGAAAGAEGVQFWEVAGADHFVPVTHPAELAAVMAPALAACIQDS